MSKALERESPDEGLVLHSDQGVQFTSWAFVEYCKSQGIRQSMSKTGCPYDNAPMERFYKSLKSELYLQPILDLNTEKIVKAEALIRWNHKKYGLVAPNDFIPVAEKSNLILKIGEWVMEEACRILKRWEYKNVNIPISINISGKQLLQYNLPGVVEGIIKKYDVESEKLIMEVTENYIFEEAEHLKEIINRL